VNAITNPEDIDRCREMRCEELEVFLTNGPSSRSSLMPRKAYLESQKVAALTDPALAGQIIANFQIGRTFAHTSEMEKRIAALTPDD